MFTFKSMATLSNNTTTSFSNAFRNKQCYYRSWETFENNKNCSNPQSTCLPSGSKTHTNNVWSCIYHWKQSHTKMPWNHLRYRYFLSVCGSAGVIILQHTTAILQSQTQFCKQFPLLLLGISCTLDIGKAVLCWNSKFSKYLHIHSPASFCLHWKLRTAKKQHVDTWSQVSPEFDISGVLCTVGQT